MAQTPFVNKTDHQLNRLFESAILARRETAGTVPFNVEERVLADWRRRARLDDGLFGMLPLLRLALGLACAVVVATLAFHFRELSQPPGDEVAIINSPLSLSALP